MLRYEDSTSDRSVVTGLLEDIWNITVKIKRELNIINDLVGENGDFNTAIEQTNKILLKVIEEKQLDLDSSSGDENNKGNDSDSDSNDSDQNVLDTSKTNKST